MAVRARGRRVGADEQVRRGASGSPLLRRLRDRRRGRAARDRAGEVAVRRRACERPAALRGLGEHGRLLRGARAGRHGAGAATRPWRPSHAWPSSQLLGSLLPLRRLRRQPRGRAHRHGRPAAPRARAPPEADRRRRLGLPARDRCPRLPRDRRRGRCAPDGRHGPLLGSRCGGAAPESRRVGRHRDLDDAQDARRAALGLRALSRRARRARRPRRVPRSAGRAALSRDRGEGGLLRDRRDTRVRRVLAGGARQRERARGGHRRPEGSTC